LFAATVVPASARVTLVEGSASACADARVNLAGRAATVIESAVEQWSPTVADVVIADPARSGLGAEAAAVLAGCSAPVLVLVSCDPVSLARDAVLLGGLGYRHAGTTVLDLFPHTHHVETVTRFELFP
jgi:23S rRNA (uracil1939-C5)-methyltransferase